MPPFKKPPFKPKAEKNKIYNMQKLEETSAEIMIYGDISDYWGDVSSKEFKRELDRLGNLDKLSIRINSNGGSVTSGYAIYNVLKQHKAEKTVYIDGIAASMGAFIAMAGDRILMSNAGLLMVHKPWGVAMGEAEELRKEADVLDKMFNIAVQIHAQRTGTPEDEVREIMKSTTYLDSEEALELGFIDEIISYDGENTELDTESNMLYIAGEKMSLANFMNKKELMQKLAISESGFMKQKNIKKTKEGDEELMNLEELKEKHPDIYNQARTEGVQEERNRMQSIDEAMLPGTEEMVQKMKYTEPKSATEATTEIIKAFKNSPNPVQQAQGTVVGQMQAVPPVAVGAPTVIPPVIAGVTQGMQMLQNRQTEAQQGNVTGVSGNVTEITQEEKNTARAGRLAKKMEGKVR